LKLPVIKKILREDLKGAPSWVQGIIDPVNQFMEYTYQILNKNVTYTENFSSFVKELTYTTPSTYPSGVSNVSFQNTLKSKASGLILAQIYDTSLYLPPSSAVYVPWVENNGSIVIYPITGLAASKTYLLRLVVF
jgi:hypothetical protein